MTFVKKWAFRLISLAVAVISLLAATENSTQVALSFLGFSTWEWPISYWMVIAFLVGLAVGVTLNIVSNTKLRMQARKANRNVEKTNEALDKAKASS
ncbi:MAG: LapA family protein [Pseudomonadales bacterium]|nr:LapA family protein [Pseudomonadales bacterium]